jgi:hypothetical protein
MLLPSSSAARRRRPIGNRPQDKILPHLALAAILTFSASAQVYSPVVIKAEQPDASSLKSLVRGIYAQAQASTPREKAEAIWRFFLTDGRFVKPGFWYHIAGWAYEEPKGEVLDAVKLLNSYGFGLCYHIAPLLEGVFEAGGFEDARVWFLTGHTVAEVFYDGAYHYFDSDMLGYNPVGTGPVKQRPVASVHQIEQDGSIITGKLLSPKQADPSKVDAPWYPADVRANAIPDLAALFTTTGDNWVYPFQRYAAGHTMDYMLRPGERMIRYFHPADDRLYYLPWRNDGSKWREFPQEISAYRIRTADGPASQKDSRRWATGRIEYRPPDSDKPTFVVDMPSPYVIIGAAFRMNARVGADDVLRVETSTDAGRTWTEAAALAGPHEGTWQTEPAVIAQSSNGKQTAVSGAYGYQVRFKSSAAEITGLVLATDLQLNPRTLPELTPGSNELRFHAASSIRTELPVRADQFRKFALASENVEQISDRGQTLIRNTGGKPGTITFLLESPDTISGIDAGGRFLDLRDGLAPDKLTAETRRVTPWPAKDAPAPSASIAWSLHPNGPWQTIWSYDPKLVWRDGQVIDRTLRWPEVDRNVNTLPAATRRVYVRYTFESMAMDDFRLAWTRSGLKSSSPLQVTHIWKQNGQEQRRSEQIPAGSVLASYRIDIPDGVAVDNEAIVFETPGQGELR